MDRLRLVCEASARYREILDAVVLSGSWDGVSSKDIWDLYLMLSYCYYELDESPIPDYLFDGMCKRVEYNPMWIGSHLYDASALSAGSGFHMVGKFPVIVMDIAAFLIKEKHHGRRTNKRPHC